MRWSPSRAPGSSRSPAPRRPPWCWAPAGWPCLWRRWAPASSPGSPAPCFGRLAGGCAGARRCGPCAAPTCRSGSARRAPPPTRRRTWRPSWSGPCASVARTPRSSGQPTSSYASTSTPGFAILGRAKDRILPRAEDGRTPSNGVFPWVGACGHFKNRRVNASRGRQARSWRPNHLLEPAGPCCVAGRARFQSNLSKSTSSSPSPRRLAERAAPHFT
mmetsp:Transcript_17874/g.47187  ORF Transcript_17874/g.47187 Transcript_17874/m.47187 type:complete len:217 (+) Transcript_17874:824-1474(+)